MQFARTKQKTRKNLILYYADFTNSIARNACIYSFNRRVYVDIQLSSTPPNDAAVDRYKVLTCDYNRLLSSNAAQFNQMLNTLILYAYEPKKY